MQTSEAGKPGAGGQKQHEVVKSLLQSQPDTRVVDHSSAMDYGSLGPVVDDFLPLSGGEDEELWLSDQYPSESTGEKDPNRTSARTLIYLCALCSSLTSVLLGYGTSCPQTALERKISVVGQANFTS